MTERETRSWTVKIPDIDSIEKVFEAQARINKKKRNLQRRDDQTAADWLALAEEYKAIDSRANMAFCTSRAATLGAKAESFPLWLRDRIAEKVNQTLEEKEEWWQK